MFEPSRQHTVASRERAPTQRRLPERGVDQPREHQQRDNRREHRNGSDQQTQLRDRERLTMSLRERMQAQAALLLSAHRQSTSRLDG
jgi:hypothetical protein